MKSFTLWYHQFAEEINKSGSRVSHVR